MKKQHLLLKLLLSITLILSFLSCSENDLDKSIITSSKLIEFEGEGGETLVSLNSNDWKIVEIINKNNNQPIIGDIYTISGKSISENSKLKLDSLGVLYSIWADKGFIIHKENSNSLKISVKENYVREEFVFDIILKTKEKFETISVRQKVKSGFQLEKIEYNINEKDTDSTYYIKGNTYKFDIQTEQKFVFSPFSGIVYQTVTFFDSSLENAFYMTKSDSLFVPIPSFIEGKNIILNGETALFSNVKTIKENEYKNLKEELNISPGKSEFSIFVEIMIQKIEYQLFLIDARTKEQKVITGKWTKISPTGKLKIN